jgi:hypothetical protein
MSSFIGIWVLGLLVAAGAYLIQSQVILGFSQIIFYVIGTIISIAVLRLKYLEDLHRGFKSQQCTAVRLEKALGLFTPGVFDDEKESIYPKKWEGAGTEEGDGRFFHTTYALLYVGTVFLVIAILMSGCWY